MEILPTPPSPTQSATGNLSPGWQLGYSAFGLFGLIVLGAFGTWFAMCLLRVKQTHPMGEYTPNTIEEFERAYRLTRPPPRRKWWRVLGENFCCCFGVKRQIPNIEAILMAEGRLPTSTGTPPSPPIAPPLGPETLPRPVVAPKPKGRRSVWLWVQKTWFPAM